MKHGTKTSSFRDTVASIIQWTIIVHCIIASLALFMVGIFGGLGFIIAGRTITGLLTFSGCVGIAVFIMHLAWLLVIHPRRRK